MQRRHFIASASALVIPSSFAQSSPPANALIIGCSADVTGPLADNGKSMQRGTEAAFAEINSQGGINGRPLYFSLMDDGYKSDNTVVNAKALLANNKVLALMSCLGTPNNTAITPLIEATDLAHLGPLTGAASLRKPSIKNLFHVRASYTDEVHRLVDNLLSMNLGRLAIAYQDNGLGKELLQVGLETLTKRGIETVAQVPVATDGKGVDEAVKQLLAAKPSAMLLFTAGNVSTDVALAARTLSPGLPIAGLSVTLSSKAIAKLGVKASGIALTMILPDANSTKHLLIRRFQSAMRASKQDDFNSKSLEGYVNAQLMIEALKKVGRNPSRSELRESISTLRSIDLGGYRVDFSSRSSVGSDYVELGVLSRSGRLVG